MHQIEDASAVEQAMIRRAAEQIPVFFSANMSLGVALLVELAKQAAEEETRRTKTAYEKALAKYELAQNEILHLIYLLH